MPRLSSPLLPLAVFPSIQSRQAARNAKLREAAEEGGARDVERASLDAARRSSYRTQRSHEIQRITASNMSNYEEQFGKFIPDNENADWHARKEAAVRCVGRPARGSRLHDYFGAVDVYEAEFGITFDLDDGWSQTLKTKRKLLERYDYLMDWADGNRQRASDIAGRGLSFTGRESVCRKR
ncbi:hypothetical protein C8R44DRAFT_748751 [Mycena epipterygia]|nr:hypothetical protein C8R44DRAFT_748751 [Mycena epipterygia]